MQHSSRRWIVILPVVLLVASGAIMIGHRSGSAHTETRVVQPTRRPKFALTVTTTGELRAKKFVDINGPNSMDAQVFQTKITWMVPEGTTVKQGDRVAELDRSPAETRRQTVLLDVQKADAELTNTQLDSSLALAQAREDVRTADYTLEEKKLARAEAEYEAPTLKRQAQIDFEKAQRAAVQTKRTLEIKTRQAVAKFEIAEANLKRAKRNLQAVEDAIDAFTVRAPDDGMVIYRRENGQPKGTGSMYYLFDPAVATLPDLSAMQSQTYVNEVDIRKIAVGQPVQITLDADPAKRLAGRVVSVANVGEQRADQDAKVFEVIVDISTPDTTLRPGMTTANKIEVAELEDVLTIPLRSVTTDSGFSYVYKQDGDAIVRQMIDPGSFGSMDVVVKRGLAATDRVLLGPPPVDAEIRTVRLPGVKPRTR